MPAKLGWPHLTLASIVLVLGACSVPPPTVAQITIVNQTRYDLDVEVNGGDGGPWLPVAIAEAGTTDSTQEVVDQGRVWIFRFRHWGDPIGELSLTRAELEGSGWRIQVPRPSSSVSSSSGDLRRPMRCSDASIHCGSRRRTSSLIPG